MRVHTFENIKHPKHTKNNNMESRKVNNVYYILGTVQMHTVYIGYSPRAHIHTHGWHMHAKKYPIMHKCTHTRTHNLKHTHTRMQAAHTNKLGL